MFYNFDKRIDHGINKFHYELSNDYDGVFNTVQRNHEDKVFTYNTEVDGRSFSMTLNRKYEDTGRTDVTVLECAQFTIGEESGSLLHCIKKGKNIFNNEWYEELTYGGHTYKCYEVGRGKEGTFYCIYRGESLVAMIRKDPVSLHCENNYGCYAYDDVPVAVLLVFNIYFDIHKYYETSRYSNKTLHTWQKWAKSKFDPDFIETIRTNKTI